MAWLIAMANDHGEPIHETTRDVTEQVLDASRCESFDAKSTAQLCAAEDICLDEHGWSLVASTINGSRVYRVMNGIYWAT